MITYSGLDLFSSGSSSIAPGATESRHAVASSPNAIGAAVITQGTLPRTLLQHGTLVADNAVALQVQIDAIRAQVGTSAGMLIDQLGTSWDNCLMQRFETSVFRRLGPRLMTQYEITYLQAHV